MAWCARRRHSVSAHDVGGRHASLGEACCNASEFLDRPADEVWRAWVWDACVAVPSGS